MRATILLYLVFSVLFIVFLLGKSSEALPIPGKSEFTYQLYYYWDLRDRDSFIQVTNNGTSTLELHIQLFQTDSICNEIDFFDQYTQDDTHIYDLRNIQSNDGNPLPLVLADNSFGFAVITVMDSSRDADDTQPVLSGNFRIVDDDGYEYRSVAASYPVLDTVSSTNVFSFNYRTIDTNTFADIVGISVSNAGAGFEAVQAGPGTVANFSLAMFDINEVIFSCSPETFTCAPNVGLNMTIPNSKGLAANLCPFLSFPEGFVNMSLDPGTSTADFFVGFIGINNGGNRGGMEIITALP